MAAGIAADLTEAYRILMDPALRGKYNDDLFGGPSPASPRPTRQHPPAGPESEPPPPPPASPPRPSSSSSSSSSARLRPIPWRARAAAPSPGAGVDFVKRASLSRVKAAVDEVLGSAEPVTCSGFDMAVVVEAEAGPVQEGGGEASACWSSSCRWSTPRRSPTCGRRALKAQGADATLCVLLIGPGLAPVEGPGDRHQRAAPEVTERGPCARAGRCERLGSAVSPGYAGIGPDPDPAAQGREALSGNRPPPFA